MGGGDYWGQDSDVICLALALLGGWEKADLRARNLVKFSEAPNELGHLANASLKNFASPWGRMKPRACPQGVPSLVREQETNNYKSL